VVGSGVRHGRDAHIADMRARADMWLTNRTSTVMATRGERLALMRIGLSSRDQGHEAFVTELLIVDEIDADERLAAGVAFDLDDFDAAIAELDARYLAGEAAAHARTWSAIAGTYASVNQHELPALTPDCVTIDHRRVTGFAPGELTAYIRAGWEIDQTTRTYVEVVHQLSDLGAVCTYAGYVVSREGFDGEQRGVNLATVDGGLVNRSELFDEADLDAALARFEELQPQARRLENAASRVLERFRATLAAHDWAAIAETLADNICTDDRRRVVNAGIRHGRDAEIEGLRTTADLGLTNISSTVIATRGGRLVLTRARSWGRDQRPEAFLSEVLSVTETNADDQIAAYVTFDLDDIDAAFEELDARYLAGEAADHSHTWSVITRAYATLNQRALPATTPDWVNIDHRRARAFASGDMTAYIRAGWDLEKGVSIYTEAVHRLTNVGAVVTTAAHGTSHEGFDAEWRVVTVVTVEGDRINRCEVFDEADLDVALARFEELHPQARRLANAATRVSERMEAYYVARNWDAITEILADGHYNDDRRRVVNAGIRHGRDVEITNMRAAADLGTANITSTVIATRGECLALRFARYLGRDPRPEAFRAEALLIVEIDADERILAFVLFDVDDINAAFDELDARYLVGEAAAHADTWSVIIGSYAAFNRHEFPAADWVTVDHRSLVAIGASDLPATIRAIWDLTPDLSIHVEAVHRLSSFGAVVTDTVYGTSPEGSDAEWRMIQLLTVEGDRINRCEVFDEADIDAALTRFEELQPQAPRLENAASQVEQRSLTYFAARDWDALAEILWDDLSMDDRRHVVNAGVRHGRDAEIASQRAVADVGVMGYTSTVVAIRGDRLALGRYSILDGWSGSKVLCVVEINAENQIVARVVFDSDDIDAAFEELDARYLAGEAAEHAHTWSVIAALYAGFNRRERPPTTPGWSFIDHRPLISVEAGDLPTFITATLDELPVIRIYMETVHRLSDLGVVVTHTARGISDEDFGAEWRMIDIFTVEGDLISRCEMFDEADLDTALATFDELSRSAPRR
jgi:hypothetical protein